MSPPTFYSTAPRTRDHPLHTLCLWFGGMKVSLGPLAFSCSSSSKSFRSQPLVMMTQKLSQPVCVCVLHGDCI